MKNWYDYQVLVQGVESDFCWLYVCLEGKWTGFAETCCVLFLMWLSGPGAGFLLVGLVEDSYLYKKHLCVNQRVAPGLHKDDVSDEETHNDQNLTIAGKSLLNSLPVQTNTGKMPNTSWPDRPALEFIIWHKVSVGSDWQSSERMQCAFLSFAESALRPGPHCVQQHSKQTLCRNECILVNSRVFSDPWGISPPLGVPLQF